MGIGSLGNIEKKRSTFYLKDIPKSNKINI